MQGNMGYGNSQGFGPNGFMGNSNGTGNSGWSNGWNGTGVNQPQLQMQTPVQPQQAQRQSETKIIVNGRAAAIAISLRCTMLNSA